MPSRNNNAKVQIGLAVGGGAVVLFFGIVGVILLAKWTKENPRGQKETGTDNNGQQVPSVRGRTELPQGTTERYNGADVDFWGRQLLDLNRPTSFEAAQALRQMGEESLRWFKRGLESPHRHVREHSVIWMPQDAAGRYGPVFEPILIRMLDTDFDLVLPIATQLQYMKSSRGKAILERRLKDADTENKRRALKETLDQWPK